MAAPLCNCAGGVAGANFEAAGYGVICIEKRPASASHAASFTTYPPNFSATQ
jgi:hypothetical protein